MEPGEAGAHDPWRRQLAHRLRRLDQLPARWRRPGLGEVVRCYPLSITPYYASLIDWDDPLDPIARQCVPAEEELEARFPDSSPDPLGEAQHSPVRGVVHRYPDRVLLLAGVSCPVLCRHCNRKRTWRRPEALVTRGHWEAALEYLRRSRGVREVILSGGDPLMLPTGRLARILQALRSIPHLEVIRVGSRVPVTLPQRITPRLGRVLEEARPLWLNTHFNHPREITPASRAACEALLRRGIPVSNHTVLLKGVNDRRETLEELFRRLQAISVRPYYLFQCDSAQGTDHFRVELDRGMGMVAEMWGRCSGLMLPRFVVDLPGGKGKVSADPIHLQAMGEGRAEFVTFEGERVLYRW